MIKTLGKKTKRLLERIGLAIVTVGLLAIWFLSIDKTANDRLKEVDINIKSVEGVKDMIERQEVYDMVNYELKFDLHLIPLKKLDLRAIETVLKSDSRIHAVEVFVDARKVLTFEIEQRRPIMRIMNDQGEQYYLDQAGNYIAKTENRSVRVPVVTGDIEAYIEDWQVRPDSKIRKAHKIATLLYKDDFLASLIEQVHFEKSKRVVLVPKIGKEKIILRYLDDLEEKLDKIEPFYKDMAKRNSWGKYSEIDISYKKQVLGINPVKP